MMRRLTRWWKRRRAVPVLIPDGSHLRVERDGVVIAVRPIDEYSDGDEVVWLLLPAEKRGVLSYAEAGQLRYDHEWEYRDSDAWLSRVRDGLEIVSVSRGGTA